MKYAALFRGINVGGKNLVKMDDLKRLFLDLGLSSVRTYIQSGNAVFETNLEEAALQKTIHAGFSERFRLKGDVIIRNIDEIKALIDSLPFSAAEIAAAEAADPQVEHLYVYFLDHPHEQVQIDSLCRENTGPDLLRMGIREGYLLCCQSIRKSKLALRAAREFDSATVRNWKTVVKLYDMLTAL
ncbi:DUF1697 domain-containing protein [Caproiciproducens sp. NJN-50]|uniref:DUF1697 domain-containing protein n=1 Tax=Acutalibacteraceae TaxID=3082771 RepID=UPI000FFE1D4B|nr:MULTISPECIES: DUF1697 domain-containing protein [Acutalibacteraceae]QAT50804.1 DUF1697 domain-containing protein [Caproiciproducens sp. NJN-50]